MSTLDDDARADSPFSDFLDFELLLDEEDRELLSRVRAFTTREIEPIINDYWTRAEFPHQLVAGLAELGIAGLAYDGPGCPNRGDGRVSDLHALLQALGDERVEIAVQHVGRAGAFDAGAQILHQLVGLQDVGSDLVAPADFALRRLGGVGCRFALLQFFLVKARTQHLPRLGLVLVLRALGLAGDRNSGGEMRDAHGGIRGVDVLSAGTG